MKSSFVLVTNVISTANASITNSLRSMADSVKSQTTTISTTVRNMVTDVQSSLNTLASSGFSSASNFMQGVINGTNAMAPQVNQAIKRIGDGMVETLKKTLDERSPSRKAITIAKLFDQGIINGLNALAGNIISITKNIGDDMISTMSTSLDDLDKLEGKSLTPTVSPIMDLSSYNRFNGTLQNQRLGYNFNGTLDHTNEKLSKSIDNLAIKVERMSNNLAHIQIRLDGKTLVGELAPEMDFALGVRQQRLEMGL